MKIHEKLPHVRQWIDSVADHRDEDSTLRLAALDQVVAHIDVKRAEIAAEAAADIAAAFPPE